MLTGHRPLALLVAAATVSITAPSVVPSASAAQYPQVDFPLLHDNSMVPGLPGHGKAEPTSCYDTYDGDDSYVCRIVAGYEETGDEWNFEVKPGDALDVGHNEVYGASLVSRRGYVYEGCEMTSNGNWACDYRTRRQVSASHYKKQGLGLRVFWNWLNHTADQAQCAAAITGLWSSGKAKGFAALLGDCKNGPVKSIHE